MAYDWRAAGFPSEEDFELYVQKTAEERLELNPSRLGLSPYDPRYTMINPTICSQEDWCAAVPLVLVRCFVEHNADLNSLIQGRFEYHRKRHLEKMRSEINKVRSESPNDQRSTKERLRS